MMRQIVKALAVALLLTTFASNSAHAALGWFIATVEKVGIAGGSGAVFIRLTDTAPTPAFTSIFFQAATDIQKEMLAIGLAAQVSDVKVQVFTDPAEPGSPILQVMYLTQD